MSTPDERARALVWAGGFLIQISRNRSLPLSLRRQATVIARHFPTIEVIRRLASRDDLFGPVVGPLNQSDLEKLCSELEHGPLTDRTRLRWPE